MSLSEQQNEKGQIQLVLLLFLILVFCVLVGSQVRQVSWEKRTRALYSRLYIGMSHAELEEALLAEQWPKEYFELRQDDGSIETPLTFGAKNWLLYLEFDDGKLSSVQVRNLDSNRQPIGAPPSLGKPLKTTPARTPSK